MQGMAARLGIITQEGLAENLKHDFAERPVLRNILCGDSVRQFGRGKDRKRRKRHFRADARNADQALEERLFLLA